MGTAIPQCTQFLHRVHELAVAFIAVLEFEGMDVVVLAIALGYPGPAPCRARRLDPKWFGSSVSKIRTLYHSQSGKQRSGHSASRLRLSLAPRKTGGSPLSVVSCRRSRPRRNRLCRCNRSAPLHAHVVLDRGTVAPTQFQVVSKPVQPLVLSHGANLRQFESTGIHTGKKTSG